jgi:hypothetical protein
MKTLRARVTAFIGLVALMAGSVHVPAQAQDKRVEKKPDNGSSIETLIPVSVPLDLGGLEAVGSTIKFLEAKFAFDKLVKGAPYSAVAVTETTQTLSDGNQIIRKSEVTLYRDSEGRTRREQTLEGVKNWPAAGEPPRMIFINDPIAGSNYVLDPSRRTARKTMGPVKRKPGDPIYNEKEKMIEKLDKAGRKMVMKPDSEQPDVNAPPAKITKPLDGARAKDPAPDGATMAPRPVKTAPAARAKDPAPDGATMAPRPVKTAPAEGLKTARPAMPEVLFRTRKTESLGKQMIEGIEAEGTRSTATIGAGEIGNRLPIEIVDERWYSPELQTLLMSKHHDPRSGDTIYRITNINRSEPDRSLFDIPSDYTLNEVTKSLPVKLTRKPGDDR